MKYVTIYYGNNKIELHNSIWGKETIKVNDEIVSSKYSIFGKEHNFTIDETGKPVACQLTTGLGFGGIKYDVTIDGRPLIETPKNQWGRFFAVLILAWVVFVLLDIFYKKV